MRTKHFQLVNHPREGQLLPYFLFVDVYFMSLTFACAGENLVKDLKGFVVSVPFHLRGNSFFFFQFSLSAI